MKALLDFKTEAGVNRGGEDAVLSIHLTANKRVAKTITAKQVVDLLFASRSPHQLDGSKSREDWDGLTAEYTQEELERYADDSELVCCNDRVFVAPKTRHYGHRLVLTREELLAATVDALQPSFWKSRLVDPKTFTLDTELVRRGNAD